MQVTAQQAKATKSLQPSNQVAAAPPRNASNQVGTAAACSASTSTRKQCK
jgi:hypothetical protein